MYLLKALRPGAKDALTGNDIPEEGVRREVLLPPDHYAERTGDLSIEVIKADAPAATAGELAASDSSSAGLQDAPAAEARASRASKATSTSS